MNQSKQVNCRYKTTVQELSNSKTDMKSYYYGFMQQQLPLVMTV